VLWQKLQHPWQEEAVKTQLRLWSKTKHMPGQAVPGVGVDCVRFVCSVLHGLTGLVEWTSVPSQPPTALRHLTSLRLTEERIWPDEGVMPTDILVAGPDKELHLYLACLVPNQWWHAGFAGVYPTSTVKVKKPLRRLLRPTGKSLWIPAS
jgi:hypothetical protein